ncbi:MAG: hypothetical protein R3F34_13910 [Planctomycetota bacterium]
MIFRTRVQRHEVGLVLRGDELVRVLGPGRHQLDLDSSKGDRLEVLDTTEVRLEHPLLERLVEDPFLRERILAFELDHDERAVVWVDEALHSIVGAGRHAFWKAPHTLRVDRMWLDDDVVTSERSCELLPDGTDSRLYFGCERTCETDEVILLETENEAGERREFWVHREHVLLVRTSMREIVPKDGSPRFAG